MAAHKGMAGLTPRGRAMQRLLARWARSGLTLAEFARRAGMPPGRLGWWRHTLRTGQRAVRGARFVELPVRRALAEAPPPAPAVFEVVFGDGMVVRVPAVAMRSRGSSRRTGR